MKYSTFIPTEKARLLGSTTLSIMTFTTTTLGTMDLIEHHYTHFKNKLIEATCEQVIDI
jgi:hypothetical protein